MKTPITLLAALFLLVCLPARAQLRWTYTSGYTVTGTSAKLTLQLPSNATRTLRPIAASVVCPAACTITLSLNGSAATTTSATIYKNRTANPTPQTLAYTDSDSTGGTALTPYPLPNGGPQTLDLSDMEFAAGERLTITVTSTASQNNTVIGKFEEY